MHTRLELVVVDIALSISIDILLIVIILPMVFVGAIAVKLWKLLFIDIIVECILCQFSFFILEVLECCPFVIILREFTV